MHLFFGLIVPGIVYCLMYQDLNERVLNYFGKAYQQSCDYVALQKCDIFLITIVGLIQGPLSSEQDEASVHELTPAKQAAVLLQGL